MFLVKIIYDCAFLMLAHSLREEGGTKGKESCYRNSLEISRPWVELRVCTCPPLGVYFGGVSSCPWLTHLCISGTHFFFTATLFTATSTAVACGSRNLKRLAVFIHSVVAFSFQEKRLVSCLHEIDFTPALKRKR